jgi:hypothetical protein
MSGELYRRVVVSGVPDFDSDGPQHDCTNHYDYVRDTEAEKWVRLGRALWAGMAAWLDRGYNGELAEAMVAAITQEYTE